MGRDQFGRKPVSSRKLRDKKNFLDDLEEDDVGIDLADIYQEDSEDPIMLSEDEELQTKQEKERKKDGTDKDGAGPQG